MDVEFDDRTFTGSHYGHLCRAIVALNGVTLMDEREGSQNQAILPMRWGCRNAQRRHGETGHGFILIDKTILWYSAA
jgi:hypothetical protein